MRRNLPFIMIWVLIFPFGFHSLWALTTEEALSNMTEEQKSSFKENKRLLEVAPKKRPVYFPSFISAEQKAIIDTEIKKLSPNILIEGLYLIPKKGSLNMLYFYNSLLAVKPFKEIKYLNEGNGLTQPLLGYSYVVDSRESKVEQPDMVARTLEPSREFLVYQDFLPESPVFSIYSYTNEPGQLRFKSIIKDPVKVRGFTGIKPERLISRLIIQETETDFVVYALSYARVASLFGTGEKLFTYRIKGLFNWYYNTYLSRI